MNLKGNEMKLILTRLLAVATLALGFGLATVPVASQAANDSAQGEVRKIDKDAKKITIKHGEIKNLDMPPMTMVFQVKDINMLDKVKAGDMIQFRVVKEGSSYVITEIVRAE
jgi:Cu(I)/Ag(I) efflux system periplasmic protein CusF